MNRLSFKNDIKDRKFPSWRTLGNKQGHLCLAPISTPVLASLSLTWICCCLWLLVGVMHRQASLPSNRGKELWVVPYLSSVAKERGSGFSRRLWLGYAGSTTVLLVGRFLSRERHMYMFPTYSEDNHKRPRPSTSQSTPVHSNLLTVGCQKDPEGSMCVLR